jgi:thiamine biosynthesis lipoprotein
MTAEGHDAESMNRAIESAFVAMERVEKLMSFFRPDSDVARLNRQAFREQVMVNADTFLVLEHGLALSRASNGAFDFTVASPLLVQMVQRENAPLPNLPGDWRDVELLPGNRVSFRRPLHLDLGGIAKGFAVDVAVDCLRATGVESGMVNAGGDLRAFGPRKYLVDIRHPAFPQAMAHRVELQGCALATSSPCFTETERNGQRVSHLVNPLDRSSLLGHRSVSVQAPECWLADGLAKVVFNAPLLAETLLEEFGAHAFVLSA